MEKMITKGILEVARPEAMQTPIPPAVDDLGTTRWLDRDGDVVALGHECEGVHWIHVLGVASYCFDGSGERATAFPSPESDQQEIFDRFARTIWPIMLQVRGLEVLHASAVLTPAGVVVLCAASETGKSTVAFGLAQRGFQPWADDAVVFAAARGAAISYAIPFRLRLRPPTSEHFARYESAAVRLDEGWGGRGADAAPVRAICLLARDDGPGNRPVLKFRRLSSTRAFPVVFSHANFFSLRSQDQKSRTIRHYLDLISTVPVYELEFRSGLDNLPLILDALEGTLL